jgi:hypothetical protein
MSKRYASVDRSREIKSKREFNSIFPQRNLVLNINDFDISNIFNQTKPNILRTLNPQKFKSKKLPIITKQITSSQLNDINSKTSELSTEVNNIFINEKENNEMDYILKTDANKDNNSDNYYKVIIHSDFRDKRTVNNNRINSENKKNKQKINNPIKNLIQEEKSKIKYPPILRSERLYPKINQDKNRINILKKIKSIRNRNLKMKNNKNLLFPIQFKSSNDNIAYESKFRNIVFDANKVLNTHIEKDNEFNLKDNINTFISQNKELCLNNLLVKILKKENKNLKENFEIRSKNVENSVKTLSKDEKDFELYSIQQKKLYYKTNDLLNQIHTRNYVLYKLYYELQTKSKVLEDEIFKMIEQIESLRIFAKFVTKVLGGNDKIFDGELIPSYENTSRPDIKILIKIIFEKYGNLLENRKLSVTKNTNNTNNEIEKDLNLNDINNNNSQDDETNEEVDIDILNDPHFMLWKFKDFEERILQFIEKNDIYAKYANKEYENYENIIKELKLRIVKLKKELEYSEKNLSDFKNMIFGKNFQENENKIYYGLIKDLCKDIYEFDGRKYRNKNLDIFELNDDISQSLNILTKKEREINKHINNLELYEKTDNKLFSEIMNKRKDYLNIGDNAKTKKLHEKFYKIIIKSKKSEPPYYKLKKEEVIKEDKNEVINRENSELITYK